MKSRGWEFFLTFLGDLGHMAWILFFSCLMLNEWEGKKRLYAHDRLQILKNLRAIIIKAL